MSDDTAQLLALMQRDPDAARQLAEANVGQLAAANPMMAMVMQMMTAQRGQAESREETRRARVERVRTHVRELQDALAGAHSLLGDLAAALGACGDCWGELDACPTCRGRGGPGWRAPDDGLFDELVTPAVRRRARNQPKEGSTE
ncbi:MAG: hypothetical protein IPL61_32215 [Myxococcales bacterium]|nr:hypothetical protein [Myxococcales bacterium]